MKKKKYFTYFFLILAVIASAVGQTPMSACNVGRNTFYQTNGMAGSCSYGSLTGPMGPGYLFVTALNQAWFNNSALCGVCFQVSGPSASVRIMVTDLCPAGDAVCGGDMNHFDLSAEAFAAIAPSDLGLTRNNYRMVSCDVNGNVKLQFATGSSTSWVGMLIANHRVGIAKFEIQETGKQWREIQRTSYNRYDFNIAGPLPWNIRLTGMAVAGGTSDVRTAQVTSVTVGNVYDLGFQFVDPKPAVGCGTSCPLALTLPIIFSDSWFPNRSGSFAVAQDWQVTGWSMTNNTVSNPTYSGNGAIAVTITDWGGYGVMCNVGVTRDQVSGIEMYMRAQSGTVNNLKWYINDDSATQFTVPTLTTTYQRIFINFAPFSVPIKKFVYQNMFAGTSAVFIDEWKFLVVDQTTTCAGSLTTTAAPVTTVAVTTTTVTATTSASPSTSPSTSSSTTTASSSPSSSATTTATTTASGSPTTVSSSTTPSSSSSLSADSTTATSTPLDSSSTSPFPSSTDTVTEIATSVDTTQDSESAAPSSSAPFQTSQRTSIPPISSSSSPSSPSASSQKGSLPTILIIVIIFVVILVIALVGVVVFVFFGSSSASAAPAAAAGRDQWDAIDLNELYSPSTISKK